MNASATRKRSAYFIFSIANHEAVAQPPYKQILSQLIPVISYILSDNSVFCHQRKTPGFSAGGFFYAYSINKKAAV